MGKKFEVNLVSKYRQEIYGIAAFWVMWHHFVSYKIVDFSKGGKVLETIGLVLGHGNISVDIFLFLSGISLYYAWTKNQDVDNFYRSRMMRIIPSYLMIVVPIGIIQYVFQFGVRPERLLLSLSAVEIFIDGKRYAPWYATCIVLFYIIFPAIYVFIYGKNREHHFLRFAALMLFTYGCIYSLHKLNYLYYWQVEIMINRLPVFIAGVYAGKFVKEGKQLKGITWLGLILMTVLYLYIRLTMKGWYYRVPLIIGAIPLSYFFALIGKFLNERKNIVARVILKFFRQLGSMSFEFYMLHVMFFRMVNADNRHISIGIWAIGMVAAYILSILVRNAGLKLIEKSKEKDRSEALQG